MLHQMQEIELPERLSFQLISRMKRFPATMEPDEAKDALQESPAVAGRNHYLYKCFLDYCGAPPWGK